MSFEEALTELKLGYKVARKGWNGKSSILSWVQTLAIVIRMVI